jgi:hypothetical protein
MQAAGSEAPVLTHLIDLSLGGCYLETSALIPPGTPVQLVFSIDDGKLRAEGSVLRIDPGSGIAIQFNELNRENKDQMHRILEFVHNTTAFYDNRYLSKVLNT